MNPNAISKCSCLSLIPVGQIMRFVRIGAHVYISSLTPPSDLCFGEKNIPGSVNVAHSSDNGTIKKKITFGRSDLSSGTLTALISLRALPIVATYRDEGGNLRVCGSPSYPLSIDFQDSGGVIAVSLEGSDTCQDGFVEEWSPSA